MFRSIVVALLVAGSCFGFAASAQKVEWDGLTQDAIQRAYDSVTPAICRLNYSLELTNASTGEQSRRATFTQGVIVSSDGLVMAHGHMLLDNRQPLNIKVTVGVGDDEQEYDAVLLKKPDDLNIVFLRIVTEDDIEFPYLSFDDPEDLEIGEPLVIFGILGQPLDYTRGIQTRRIGAILDAPRRTYLMDQPISFGYVGGPATDSAGRAIGVVGFDLSSQEGGDIYTRSGHPLLYQRALFQAYIDNPPSEEALGTEQENAWLGVFTQPLSDDFAEYWHLPKEGGVVVSTVIQGSPAYRSGIRSGDVIIEFDERPVNAKQDPEVVAFTKMVRESPIGEPLSLRLYRDGSPLDMRLTLAKRPISGRDAETYEEKTFGLTVRDLTTDIRIVLNVPDGVEGIIVRRVESGSPAALAGIRPGFVILAFNDQPVSDIESFKNAVAHAIDTKPDEIAIFCRLRSGTAFFRIRPRWDN